MTVSLVKPKLLFLAGTRCTWHDTDDFHDENPEQADGWLDLQWSRSELFDRRQDVRPAASYDSDYDDDPAIWLARAVLENIGAVDSVNVNVFYSADEDNIDTDDAKVSMRRSAVAVRFTDDEIERATVIIQGTRFGLF